MAFPIPNSNQFNTGAPDSFFASSDLTFFTPGADLPATQQSEIAPNDPIKIELTLRRKQFRPRDKPKGYIEADRLLNLPYQKQLDYINELSNRKLTSWYGASEEDISAVTSHLAQFGATNVAINQEQRTARFTLTYEQFRNAFLKERPDILVNLADDQLFYYNPSDYADS